MTLPRPFQPREPGAATPRRLYILAVERDPDIRAILKLALLLDPRIAVCTVGLGSEAVEEVNRSPVRFDLVLLDTSLADMAGVDLVEALHADQDGGDPPVIVLTTFRSATDLDRLADAGVIAVMEKPFDPIALADDVRRHLARGDAGCVRWWAP